MTYKEKGISATEIKKLASWYGFICIIKKVNRRDRIFITWNGNLFSQDLGWLDEIQATYTTWNHLLALFQATKEKVEQVG